MSKIFIEAVERGDYSNALDLLQKGADPNSIIDDDTPAILYVASNQHYEVPGDDKFALMAELIKKLCESGADLNVEDHYNDGLLNICFTELIPINVIEVLINSGAPISNSRGDIYNGSTEGIIRSINQSDEDDPEYALSVIDLIYGKFTQMITPAILGEMLVKCIKYLSFNYGDAEKYFLESFLPVADKLLKLGADVDTQIKNGQTALMRATMQALPKTTSYLLSKGAKTNLRSTEGNTALMFVCGELPEVSKEGYVWKYSQHHLLICKSLLKSGANKDIENKNKQTAIGIAIENNTSEIVEILGSSDTSASGY